MQATIPSFQHRAEPPLKIVLTRVLPATQKGDLAIAQAELASLREHWPAAEIHVLCRRPGCDDRHFKEADSVLPEWMPSAGATPVQFALAPFGLAADAATRAFRTTLQGADLLLFCGGGSPGGYGFGNLLKHALAPAMMAERAGVPYAFAGLGLHPYRGSLQRHLHARVLRRAALVTARDPLSQAELCSIAPRGRIALTADWAWLLEAVDANQARMLLQAGQRLGSGRLRIGMNLRCDDAADPESRRGRSGGTTGVLREVISGLLGRLDADLFVFSMNAPPASDDLGFAQRVVEGLDDRWRQRVHVLEGDYSPAQIKGMIGAMDLFIGTRLHPSLFAASMGVPLMVLHDHPKVRGFMRQIGQERWHLRLEGLGAGTVLNKALALRAESGIIAPRLSKVATEMKRRSWSNIEQIEALLSHGSGGGT